MLKVYIGMSVVLCLIVNCGLLADENVVDIDFASECHQRRVNVKGEFSGPLPDEIKTDFPVWNTSKVTSEKLSENGREFLRFNVQELDSLVLFRLSGNKIEVPGYYELKVVCRCPDKPLNLHVRQLPSPYKTFWEVDTPSKIGWQELRFLVCLKDAKSFISVLDSSNMALYISLKEGITDIASVQLIKSSKEAYISEKSEEIKRPQKGLVNLFRNTRFPLGMQSGWSVNRQSRSGSVVPDAGNPGPSGVSSLKIQSGEDPFIRVYTEPIQSDNPDQELQVSFKYKSQGGWLARIGSTSQKLAESSTWQTAKLSFIPDPLTKGFQLDIGGKGTLFLDSLMAYSGVHDQAYVSAGSCEVALKLADSELEQTHIQFIDESASVRYVVSGDFNGGILKGKVVNVYDREVLLPDVNLNQTSTSENLDLKMASGLLDAGAFASAPLGPFRVEVWVERNGKRISPYNEIILNRIRRPLYWGKDAPDSPFGGHFYANPRVLLTMKAAGMNWVRFNDVCMEGTAWGWLEKEKGKWTFSDDKINAYRDAKIKILGYLGSAPEWASYYSGKKHSYDYFNRMYQPRDIASFKNYVRTVTAHYKGRIDEYQFQNEPWGEAFWHKDYDQKTHKFDQGATPSQDYAKLSKIAYQELKKADPNISMYGFNTTGGRDDWTKQVFDYGAYPFCDMIDYHLYNKSGELCLIPDDKIQNAYSGVTGYIKDNISEPIKPVINSEGNPTRGGAVPLDFKGLDDCAGLYRNTIPWVSHDNNLKLCDTTSRYIASHLALGVNRIFLYSDHCYHYMMRPPSFPVLLGADGYPHPMLSAFSNLAWLLEDRVFVKRIRVGDKVWAYIFSGRGARVAIISGTPDGVYVVPKNLQEDVLDLFGNPIAGKALYKGRLIYVVSNLPIDFLEKSLTHQNGNIDN